MDNIGSEVLQSIEGGITPGGLLGKIGIGIATEAVTSAISAVAGHISSSASNPAPTPTKTSPMGDVQGPNTDQGGDGPGKVICTELCRNGVIEHDVWMADIRYSRDNFSAQTMRELAFRPICWSLGIVAKARGWQSSQTMPLAIQ